MNVLIVSTSERAGGGAIAAMRLKDALNRHGGVRATMMVRDRQTGAPDVVRVGTKLPKVLERPGILARCGWDMQRMWLCDTGGLGIDITRTPEYRRADVVHLHWINQGMLSLRTIERILRDGKRVVWTLHDEWPYLGVCHYRGRCRQQECLHCPIMRGGLPHELYLRKRELYARGRITFVGCSRWITGEARRAIPEAEVTHINNCIPSAIFRPMPQDEARRLTGLPEGVPTVLFCSQRVTDTRKGMAYLDRALQELPGLHVVRLGKGGRYVSDPAEMAALYAAADVFVTPGLQDNLPNTVAEAMSCGTPCVGFDTGGIPEMIDHMRTGYVARYRDAHDLAEGIRYTLAHDMRRAAQAYAATAYDERSVAQQYINLYES